MPDANLVNTFLSHGPLGAGILLCFLALWFIRWGAGKVFDQAKETNEALANARKALENATEAIRELRRGKD